MKIEFTKEEHGLFAKNHFQVITLHTIDENKEVCCVVPVKENFSKDDMLIAKIQAEKLGFKFNNDGTIDSYVKKEPLFCANYERDNKDPIIESVRQKLLDRSNVGVKKYGEHLGNYSKYNFIIEMQNEALDFANYCEVELQKEETINQLVAKYPNDVELGSEIRKIYGK